MSVIVVTLIPFLARPMSSRRWPEMVKKKALPAPAERDSQTKMTVFFTPSIPHPLWGSKLTVLPPVQ